MSKRSFHFMLFVGVLLMVIIIKLFYMQVVDDSYKNISQRNSVKEITLTPSRGEVLDRDGVYLAQSREAYDLMVTPREIKEIDTLLVCNILEIDKEQFIKRLNKAKRYSTRKASVLIALPSQQAKLALDELNISGFETKYRTVRAYPFNTAGNILGYVGEVYNSEIIQDDYYNLGDYIGRTDIERKYEKELRGTKGREYIVVDAYGRNHGRFDNGEIDIPAKQGATITLSIDQKLQTLAEELMVGKIGSLVAIEPSTGEILALVSSPTFNPDTLIGRNRSKNYKALIDDPRKPLFNRATRAAYPPGSTFKMAMALMAMQEGIINPRDRIACDEGFHVRGLSVKCHPHKSPVNLEYALQVSCNAYFCDIFEGMISNDKYESHKEGMDVWNAYAQSFGFGNSFDTDLVGEVDGFVPNSAFYDKRYRNRWNQYSAISISIGQGELNITPLQLANFAAILANRGYYYPPHLIREIDGEDSDVVTSFDRKYSMVDSHHYEPIIEAMWKSVNVHGTGALGKVEGLDICGKTGTAQNGKGEDHSSFIAFAPKDNPKIAISAYVEHGRWGSTAALPIASLMIEQYLTGTIKRAWLLESMKKMKINYPQYRSNESAK